MRIWFITFLTMTLFCALSLSQDVNNFNKSEILIAPVENHSSLNDVNKISLARNEEESKTEQYFLTNHSYRIFENKINEENPKFNIVSSFRSNIRFGGFWDKYAIINFTPEMYIKPFDFVSLYANHRISCFVPIKAVKEHFKSLAFQGAAILAVDNSVKFLISSNSLVRSIISFAAKNLAIFYIMKSFNKGNITNENKIVDYENYYYSVSIRF